MREVAKSFDIPLVENRPLARALFDTVKVNEHIQEALYTAVSEIIKYVFKIKGIKVPAKRQTVKN
jgi:flagellar biosynthetic protein FlhB